MDKRCLETYKFVWYVNNDQDHENRNETANVQKSRNYYWKIRTMGPILPHYPSHPHHSNDSTPATHQPSAWALRMLTRSSLSASLICRQSKIIRKPSCSVLKPKRVDEESDTSTCYNNGTQESTTTWGRESLHREICTPYTNGKECLTEQGNEGAQKQDKSRLWRTVCSKPITSKEVSTRNEADSFLGAKCIYGQQKQGNNWRQLFEYNEWHSPVSLSFPGARAWNTK